MYKEASDTLHVYTGALDTLYVVNRSKIFLTLHYLECMIYLDTIKTSLKNTLCATRISRAAAAGGDGEEAPAQALEDRAAARREGGAGQPVPDAPVPGDPAPAVHGFSWKTRSTQKKLCLNKYFHYVMAFDSIYSVSKGV